MKSSIQLLESSNFEQPSSTWRLGMATAGKEFMSRWRMFLAEFTKSEGELKKSPDPGIAENGDRVLFLSFCWTRLADSCEASASKGIPRSSQSKGKAFWL